MAAILGRLRRIPSWTALGAWMLCQSPAPTAAQYWGDPVTEEEARVFMTIFGDELGRCDQDAVTAHFLPGTNVYVIHADGRQEVSDRAYIRGYCNPYRVNPFKIIREDWGNVQFTQDGSAIIVTWEFALGGQGWEKRGPPKVIFNDWVKLVKDNHEIRVAGAGWQARDLVPGGEEEYFTRLYEGAPSYYLKKFYDAVAQRFTGLYGGIKQRLTEWSRKRRETAATERDESY